METSAQPGQLLMNLDVDDLTDVSFLDEAMMVSILRYRYRKRKTFTFIGEILLSLNPFEHSDVTERRKSVREAGPHTCNGIDGYPAPDISVTAKRVYVGLLDSKQSQCCVFSGESGSGKTETAKMFLFHLMRQCKGNADLERKIVLFNPLLEAFGNAKTSLNNNSSRFGKFIQLMFSGTGTVLGCKISEYLLEKSRVTHRNGGEKNFHIFHVIMDSFPAERLRKLKLSRRVRYGYLEMKHGVLDATAPSVAKNFESFLEGLSTIGFTDVEQDSIFAVLAAILNLGNIYFSDSPESGQPFPPDSQKFIKQTASLLKIDRGSLCNQLQNLEIYSRGEVISRPYSKAEFEDCRDSIAKALYNRLFGWIIYRINQVLAPKTNQLATTVGILDIFGFENLSMNSFEQLCINLANEQLHSFFNTKIFKREQDEYENEGLSMEGMVHRDNGDLLSMFLERPIGILSLIDEECHFPQGTDASLVTKFVRNFSNHKRLFHSLFYPIPERDLTEPTFSIRHYAGEVTYQANGFLEKNRDSLPDRVVVLLQSTTHPVVSSLFTAGLARTGSLLFSKAASHSPHSVKSSPKIESGLPPFGRSTRKKLTLGYQFRTSLAALFEKMNTSETHYVRCIKSNKEQKAGKFDSNYVLKQLQDSGVLETVWIRRHGFPYRPTFAEFALRFRGLFNQLPDPDGGPLTLIDSVLAPYGSQSWYMGKTKVFVKHAVTDDLVSRIRLRDTAAIRIQKCFRRHLWYRRKAAEKQTQKEVVIPSACPSAMDDDYGSDTNHSTAQSRSDNYSLADSYEVCQWFKDCVYDQLNPSRLAGRLTQPKWFFENLSRQDSEVLLRNQAVGCFLVRASQSDSSVLVLSFRAPERCRHYLIDRMAHDKLGVRGEPGPVFNDLAELLDFYRRYPLSNYTGCLSHFYGHQPPNKMKNQSAEYDQLPPNITPKTRRGMSAPTGQHVY